MRYFRIAKALLVFLIAASIALVVELVHAIRLWWETLVFLWNSEEL